MGQLGSPHRILLFHPNPDAIGALTSCAPVESQRQRTILAGEPSEAHGALPLCPRVDFEPGQAYLLLHLQDLGLHTLAILRCSRWSLVRVLPAFRLDSMKTRTPTLRMHAEVSVPRWVR